MSYSRERYIMDHPAEAARLRDKAGATAWAERFLLPHLGADARFVEVGCGPGEFVHAVLEARPGMRADGVDSSPERIEAARQRHNGNPRATFHCHDACNLPIETGTCDLAFSRFLLEYVRDKQGVVDEMFRVCRPGGKVVLQDLDGQLVWHDAAPPAVHQGIETVVSSLAGTGFDPYTGRKLRQMARRAGFVSVEVAIEAYHLIAGSIDPVNRGHWQAKFEIARPLIVKALGGDRAAAAFIESVMAYFDDPDTLTYSVLFTVRGEKPAL